MALRLNSFLNIVGELIINPGIRSASLQIRNHFRDHPANRLWRFDHSRLPRHFVFGHDDTFSCFSSVGLNPLPTKNSLAMASLSGLT